MAETQAAQKYQSLYKLSPSAYELAYKIRRKVRGAIFLMKNRKFVKSAIDKTYLQEYEEIVKKINAQGKALSYPAQWGMAQNSAICVYGIVRQTRPKIVVETGVANGFASRIILEALEKNGAGTLFSTDINPNVGGLVEQELKKRWILKIGNPQNVLEDALKELGSSIDIFIHDSNHDYDNMKKELEIASQKMSGNGIIMSDDIDENDAFVEFAAKIGKNPEIIKSADTCLGIIRLGN